MTLFLIENSLHFPRIERTEPAAKTRGENGRSWRVDRRPAAVRSRRRKNDGGEPPRRHSFRPAACSI